MSYVRWQGMSEEQILGKKWLFECFFVCDSGLLLELYFEVMNIRKSGYSFTKCTSSYTIITLSSHPFMSTQVFWSYLDYGIVVNLVFIDLLTFTYFIFYKVFSSFYFKSSKIWGT